MDQKMGRAKKVVKIKKSIFVTFIPELLMAACIPAVEFFSWKSACVVFFNMQNSNFMGAPESERTGFVLVKGLFWDQNLVLDLDGRYLEQNLELDLGSDTPNLKRDPTPGFFFSLTLCIFCLDWHQWQLCVLDVVDLNREGAKDSKAASLHFLFCFFLSLNLQLLTLILGQSDYPVSRFGLYSPNHLS